MQVTIILERDNSDLCLVHEADSIEDAIKALEAWLTVAEPDTVTDSVRAVLGEGPEVGTAAWYDSLPMIDPETGETEN